MEDKFIQSTNRYANSPEVDYYKTIYLNTKTKSIENDENIVNIDLSELFNIEREKSYKYRILGTINYLSILNNLKNNYTDIKDFFSRYDGGTSPKNIYNSFKIYLLKKSTVYTKINDTTYKERYEIISEISDLNLYNCGFSKNIFNEQIYMYNFNIDVDLQNDIDYFNKPITELFLFFDYQLDTSKNEIKYVKDFDTLSNSERSITITKTTNDNYLINDLVIGNLLQKNEYDFDEFIINEQEHKIKYTFGTDTLQFRYNPFVKIKLRDYNDTLYYGNISSNTKNIINIPDYAKPVGDVNSGNVIWKELLPHGIIDPISGLGVNFPFVNGTHYVYTDNVLAMKPDLTERNTGIVFDKIKTQGYQNDLFILNQTPNSKC